jgi:lysophospholipase L1-like esterase
MLKQEKYKTYLQFAIFIVLLSSFVMLNNKPTLYIIGDSTVRNTNRPQCGWGEMIGDLLDTTKIGISNQAMAGRSTRTFIKEKRWEKVLSALKKGDYVIMQFGHNEGSKPDTSRAGYRGVLRGTGDETVSLTWKDSSVEVVHTYGWYLRKFIREAKEKGATPIVCSMIPRNQWTDGKVRLANNDFGKWAKEIAESEGVAFVDLNAITAEKYNAMGPDEVAKLFYKDHTHTNEEGAKINASSVAEGLRLLKNNTLAGYFK